MSLPPKIVHVPPGSRAIRLDDKPALSVVVASPRDPETLAACLGALEKQCGQYQAEIVVSRSIRCAGIDRLVERYPTAHWIVGDPHADVTQLRRQGLAAAKGDIVALLEDDCVVAPDWLAQLLPGAAMARRHERAMDWAAYFAGHERKGASPSPKPSTVINIQVTGPATAARSSH